MNVHRITVLFLISLGFVLPVNGDIEGESLLAVLTNNNETLTNVNATTDSFAILYENVFTLLDFENNNTTSDDIVNNNLNPLIEDVGVLANLSQAFFETLLQEINANDTVYKEVHDLKASMEKKFKSLQSFSKNVTKRLPRDFIFADYYQDIATGIKRYRFKLPSAFDPSISAEARKNILIQIGELCKSPEHGLQRMIYRVMKYSNCGELLSELANEDDRQYDIVGNFGRLEALVNEIKEKIDSGVNGLDIERAESILKGVGMQKRNRACIIYELSKTKMYNYTEINDVIKLFLSDLFQMISFTPYCAYAVEYTNPKVQHVTTKSMSLYVEEISTTAKTIASNLLNLFENVIELSWYTFISKEARRVFQKSAIENSTDLEKFTLQFYHDFRLALHPK
ncbi:hypothetical protein M3Y95_00766300 [Aphelenchoides besseyi]|nr:hypothetical protein M3Y95_00766300 [Aphelenchoides besseyi]